MSSWPMVASGIIAVTPMPPPRGQHTSGFEGIPTVRTIASRPIRPTRPDHPQLRARCCGTASEGGHDVDRPCAHHRPPWPCRLAGQWPIDVRWEGEAVGPKVLLANDRPFHPHHRVLWRGRQACCVRVVAKPSNAASTSESVASLDNSNTTSMMCPSASSTRWQRICPSTVEGCTVPRGDHLRSGSIPPSSSPLHQECRRKTGPRHAAIRSRHRSALARWWPHRRAPEGPVEGEVGHQQRNERAVRGTGVQHRTLRSGLEVMRVHVGDDQRNVGSTTVGACVGTDLNSSVHGRGSSA